MLRHLAIGLLLMAGLVACGSPDDPEARLRETLAQAEAAIEAGSLLKAAAFISPDYRDDRGFDKRAISRLLLGYLQRHRNIHLLTRIRSVTLSGDGHQAALVLLVAMADVPLASLDALQGVRADLHRFDMTFVDGEDGWRLLRADWQRAERDQLLP